MLKAGTSLPLVMSEARSNKITGNRLPRRAILRGKDSFEHLFQNGSRIAGKVADIRYYVSSNDAISGRQTAFIAGRRLGNAVKRNRYKRLLREAYRLQQHILDPFDDTPEGSLHFAFILKSPRAGYAEIYAEVGQLLQKLVLQLQQNRQKS
ncbi:MAG: ribonuclease P protein component [Balneolales bacterium]|nr:ribonuclease P protein component [Balneolales bacterium]